MKILQALKKGVLTTPPLWMMRQAGRYLPEYRALREQAGSFFTLCDTPNLATEVTLQPINRYGFDAAIIFSDILVTLRALGLGVDIVEKQGPKVTQITDSQQVNTLCMQEDAWHTSLMPTLQALAQTRQKLAQDKALIGFAGAPFTLALYACCHRPGEQATQALKFAEENPQAWQSLINKLVDITVYYLNKQVEAGANALQIFESWAGAVPEDKYTTWVKEPILEICTRIKAQHPTVPITLFLRQTSLEKLDTLVSDGQGVFDCLGLGQEVDLNEARPLFEGRVALQGNLDPEILLKTPQDVTAAAKEICQTMAGYPGFIFNLGHGITPPTPLENVAALVKAVHTPLK